MDRQSMIRFFKFSTATTKKTAHFCTSNRRFKREFIYIPQVCTTYAGICLQFYNMFVCNQNLQ
jgi:hypothetical protein